MSEKRDAKTIRQAPQTGKAGISPNRNSRGNQTAQPKRGQPAKPAQPRRPK